MKIKRRDVGLAEFGPVQVGRELSKEHTAAIERTEELDRRHADRLKEIIDDYGWPGRSLVGRRGSHAAWLIAQHATHDPAFQRRVLGLMRGRSDVDQGEVAKLVDRLRAGTGRDQIYGTQWTCRHGRLVLVTKLEDPRSVDELASVGLETLEEDREQDPPDETVRASARRWGSQVIDTGGKWSTNRRRCVSWFVAPRARSRTSHHEVIVERMSARRECLRPGGGERRL